MRRLTVFVNSLGGGGSERQAAFLAEGLLARGWDVDVLVVHDRNEFGSHALQGRIRALGKSSRFEFLRVLSKARAAIDPSSMVLTFNWYPSAIAAHAVPGARRVIRFGGTPSADGVTGLRRIAASGAVRSAAAVVGCSWGVTKAAVRELGRPRLACAAIPNVVHFARNSPARFTWPRPYLLAAGRLSAEKDHDTLLSAFSLIVSRYPHDLLIAGDGVRAQELRDRARSLGLEERVRFLGHVEDLAGPFAGADLLVHTSRWEGFGLVITEAMAQGTPVVATDAPWGPRAIFEAVPAGTLVPVGNAQAVADAVAALLDDPTRRSSLGALGAARVPEIFAADRILDAYESLFDAVSRDRGGVT